jgi:hypothetical protein
VANIADAQLHQVTRPQFAVDRKVEQGKLTCSVSDLKANANCPNVLQLQRRLLSDELPFIPGHVLRRRMNELLHDRLPFCE